MGSSLTPRRRPEFLTSFMCAELDLAETILHVTVDQAINNEDSISAKKRAAATCTMVERLLGEQSGAISDGDLGAIQQRLTSLRTGLERQ
jgi:hypothetical protein